MAFYRQVIRLKRSSTLEEKGKKIPSRSIIQFQARLRAERVSRKQIEFRWKLTIQSLSPTNQSLQRTAEIQADL